MSDRSNSRALKVMRARKNRSPFHRVSVRHVGSIPMLHINDIDIIYVVRLEISDLRGGSSHNDWVLQ